jgi:membrane protease YdiL (CAAX protease family)
VSRRPGVDPAAAAPAVDRPDASPVVDRWLFAATVLAMIAAFAPVPLPVAPGRPTFVVHAGVFGALLLATVVRRASSARWLVTLLLLWSVTAAAFPSFAWPWAAVPAAALVLVLARHERAAWLGRHRGDRAAYLLAALGLLAQPTLLWYLSNVGRSNLSVLVQAWQLRDVPVWVLSIIGLASAAVNSFVEELLYRGMLQGTVRAWFGPAVAIGVQAVAFGLVHWAGVPGGVFGMTMTALGGVLLGIIRHRTRSILLPWLLHLASNLAIFAWIAIALRPT